MNFSGAVSSDFLKLVNIPNNKKPDFINFAATDFLSLRQSLINYVKSVYPLDYQYFIESDLGVMFIELVAYMGAVMSMKADMLANENFLATAKQRNSVRKLLELVGVKLKGPTGAAADAQITFNNVNPGYTDISIQPSDRVAQTTSPEDGSLLNYTLYKVVNGFVDTINSNGVITLYPEESDNQNDTSSIFSNLVLLEGALVTESGDFQATQSQKTVTLSQYPVIEGSVQVFLNSVNANVAGAYEQVDNIFFASGVSDKIFEIVYNDDYQATVVFGDGNVGISPDDSASYFIVYRVGGGSRGNVGSNSITKQLNVLDNASNTIQGTLINTDLATGGANAESIEKAKKYAPLTFRRQDRLVTLEDYAVFANNFAGTFGTVGKATAVTRKAYASANIIDIYLLEKASDLQLQRATSTFKRDLLESINKKKMATDDIVIVDGLVRTVDLVTTINIDSSDKQDESIIITKVRDKILNYMNVDNRDFGQSLSLPELNRVIFEVPEVRFSTIDNLDQDISVEFNEIIQLNNLSINVNLLQ